MNESSRTTGDGTPGLPISDEFQRLGMPRIDWNSAPVQTARVWEYALLGAVERELLQRLYLLGPGAGYPLYCDHEGVRETLVSEIQEWIAHLDDPDLPRPSLCPLSRQQVAAIVLLCARRLERTGELDADDDVCFCGNLQRTYSLSDDCLVSVVADRAAGQAEASDADLRRLVRELMSPWLSARADRTCERAANLARWNLGG